MSQSLARALQILGELDEGGKSLDQLAETLNVHKTTVLRLLRTLQAQRFVRRDIQHQFHLGSRLFELGASSLRSHTVRDVAQPHLNQLSRDTGGQAVHLAAYESGAAVYVAKVESTSAVRMYSRIGLPAPLHATAVGKVLASDLPSGELDAVLADMTFHPHTAKTVTDAESFRAVLAEVRQRGWAEDSAEHEDFINCIGAPIRDGTGRVVAAVSISVPDVLLTREQVHDLLPQLLEATRAIRDDWLGTNHPDGHQREPVDSNRERAS